MAEPSNTDQTFGTFFSLGGLGDLARSALDEFTDLTDDQIENIVDTGIDIGRAVLPDQQPQPDPDRGTPGGSPPSSAPLGVPPGLLLLGGVVVVLLLVK